MQKRNFFSQFKTQLVLEYIRGSKSRAEICRENNLCQGLFAKWLHRFQENAHLIFEDDKKNQQEERASKLEQIIGRQVVEIDFLKRGLRQN